MFSALSTAGDFHPEALNVMDMQWMPLSKIAEMLNSPRPRPPRRSAKAIREAMLGDREAAGGSQGTPGAGTGPGQANSPGGASASKRPARGRPAENQAGLHFVAWQILRSNNVLGWLVAQSRAHSNNAAGEEGGQAKVPLQPTCCRRALGYRTLPPRTSSARIAIRKTLGIQMLLLLPSTMI
jgi:hypothetical protein